MDILDRVMKCLVLILSISAIKGNSYVGTYSMSNRCGQEISMILESVYQLELTLDDTSSNCTVEIEGWYSYPKLMFYFEDLDLDCDDGYLEFYDGKTLDIFSHFNGNKRVQGLGSRVCDHTPSDVYTTREMTLSVRYVAKAGRHSSSDAMKIIVTSFEDDGCESYTYKCSNDRCISNEIRCTEHNSCGDGSDCRLEIGIIVGIAIGAVFGLVVIIGGIMTIVCCIRSNRRNQANRSAGQVLYTTNAGGQTQVQYPPPQTYPAGYSQPQYGQPQGGISYVGQTWQTPPTGNTATTK